MPAAAGRVWSEAMRVYLVRHGEAAVPPEGGERVLTDRGREQVERMGRFLAARRIAPAVIRHSLRIRARETAEILAAAFGDIPCEAAAGLAPEDPVGPTADMVARTDHDLMLVGHLPHFELLASELVSGTSDVAFSFPPAAALGLVTFRQGHPAAPGPVRFAVDFLVRPADLV
jgi:phosphohistidine phosphatase